MEAYRYELTTYSFKHANDSESHFRQKWNTFTDKDKAKWDNNVNRYLFSKVRGDATGSIKTHRDATVNNVLKELKKPLLEIQQEAKKELQLAKKDEYKSPAFAMRNEAPLRDLVDNFLKGSLGKSSTRDPKTKEYTYRGSEKIRAQHQDYFTESFGYDAPKDTDFRSMARALYRGTNVASISAQQGISQDEIDTLLSLHDTDPDLFRELVAQKFENLKSDNRRPAAVKLPDESPHSAYTTNRGMDYINRFYANHDKRFGLTPSEVATTFYATSGSMQTPSFTPHSAFRMGNQYPSPIGPISLPFAATNPFPPLNPLNIPQYKYPTPSKRIFPTVQAAQQAAKNWALYGSINTPSYYATSGPMQTPSFPAHTPFPYGHQYPQPIGPSPQRPYTYPVNRPDLRNKDEHTIAKVLPMLVRPTINLIKSLGNMAAESAKATQAMSVLSSALGNPFEEGTLEGITQWGGSFGDMSGSFISGVGGMLGGVGEGVGRMANNAMMGDKADVNTNATSGGKGTGLGKAAGIFSAVTGIVGAYLGGVGQSISAGWSIANGLLRSINKATLKIMDTTPIFKTIKDILNLSFTMAFLPAMTLLQGKMLPIFVDLLNKAVVFGQQFAQEFLPYIPGLVESFQGVIKHVVDFFANNKENLAQMVAGMVALLPDMMELQLGLIKLFVDNRQKILDVADRTIEALQAFTDQGLLDAVLDLAGQTADFIKNWGVPLAKATLALAKFFVGSFEGILEPIADTLDHNNKAADAIQKGDFVSAAVHSGMAINHLNPTNMISDVAVGFAKGVAGMFGVHFATGGYVPATPGGVPAIIGEGGEGEYVIPESKLNSIGGLTIVFSGNVYGMNDFKQQVRSIMNEYTTKANFR